MNARRRYALFLFSALGFVYYVVFWHVADLRDTAKFGGDTWEYQSMGVNFAKGHGIQRFGGLEPFSTYKFEMPSVPPPYYDYFISGGHVTFYRTPAYPLFLGVVYKLFGVSPRIVKSLQLLMLVIIAASLPFIGGHYWGRSGFIGGLLAGGLFLAINYRLAEVILTESLTAFAVFLVLVASMAYGRRQGLLAAAALGISLGFALLVKGTLIFLPILIVAAFLLSAIINGETGKLRRLFVMIVSMMVIVVPWCLYASIKARAPIVLATQSGFQLLSDNNEFCIDGRWHPEWRDKKDSVYNTDGIETPQYLKKVVNFYWHNPALLPRCMLAKFVAGFGPLPFLWMFTILVLLSYVHRIGNKWMKSGLLNIVWFSTLLLLGLIACIVVYQVTYRGMLDRWIANASWMSKLAPVLLIGVASYLLMTEKLSFQIPRLFWLLWANFLLVTLIFHAEASVVESRFVAPVDFLFALTCCAFAVSLLSEISQQFHSSYLLSGAPRLKVRLVSESPTASMNSPSN